MAIVKQVSFKEKERELFEYANNRGNFSEYVKGLISNDMKWGMVQDNTVKRNMLEPNIMLLQKNQEEEKQDHFIIEGERDELEL